MIMTPRIRKFALTVHVTSSVGWLGAVAGFLALAIAALTSRGAETVRAAYIAMELTGWYVIVPFCLAALFTGLVMSLGTRWGLFRHYWVLMKFLISIIAALILFGFTQTLGSLGELAANRTLSLEQLRSLNQSPALHSGGGLLVLLITTILAVYKPWGMTRYGRRKQDSGAADPESSTNRGWRQHLLLGVIVLVLLFLVLHLISGASKSGSSIGPGGFEPPLSEVPGRIGAREQRPGGGCHSNDVVCIRLGHRAGGGGPEYPLRLVVGRSGGGAGDGAD